MYHIFFIHSSVYGNLVCFHVLAVVNSATMNIEVHVSFLIGFCLFYPEKIEMPRNGLAALHGNSGFSLMSLHTVIYCAVFHHLLSQNNVSSL